MTQDRPLLGIALMLCFCVVAPLADATAKLLGGAIPLGELLVVRFCIQLLLLLPIVWWNKYPLAMTQRVFALSLARTVFHIIGIGAMFTSLRFLPLADAIAIAFVMPFIMLILGRMVLGEEVGMRRVIACVVGFGGTMLVIQPSFETVGAPALLPLLVALAFALFMMVTRLIAKETNPIGLQVVNGFQAIVILSLVFLFAGESQFQALEIIIPQSQDAILLLALGILGTSAHLLMTWSLRYAPSTTLAPMQYLEIPVATFIGWLIFNDLPNNLAALGIIITVAAGLYIIWRERINATNSPTIEADGGTGN